MLAHVSYLDIKTREVDLKIWLIYMPLVAFFYFDYDKLNLFLFIYSVVSTNLLIYIFYRMSLMGGADLFLSLILSFSNSVVYPLFPSYLSERGMEPLIILLYSTFLILLIGIINAVRNLKYLNENEPLSVKLVLAFSAKRMKVKDFINSKFLFPLTQIDEKGNRSIRTTFSVEEDDAEWRKKYKDYMEKGLINGDEYIWVMWGVPVIPFIALGYILSLIIGFPFI
ncbi:MAG: prepilin peptidase [Stygiolobus sp.]|nr:prepilin peptidase [Stygiolobus sp.]